MKTEDIEQIIKIKNRTLEKVIQEFGQVTGELKEMKLSIWDVRNILYDVCREEAQLKFDEEFVR